MEHLCVHHRIVGNDRISIKLILRSTIELTLQKIIFSNLLKAVYVLTGGLKAVIYVDGVQTVIMMIGGFILMITGLNEVGGWDKLFADYPCSAPNVTVGPEVVSGKCYC